MFPKTASIAAAAALAAAVALAAGAARADTSVYLGAATAVSLYDVDYTKAVDSTSPANVSANAGRIISAKSSADTVSWDTGVLLGVRFGGQSAYLEIEGDVVTHSGEAAGRMEGAGTSPRRNQLGDVWPEDWSQTKDRSYGLTLRLGTAAPALGASIFAFAGIRDVAATFDTRYTGCLNVTPCAPGQLTTGTETHDESYSGWIAGVGVEKELGSIGIRGEVRYSNHGESTRTVPFDEVAVVVPVELSAGEFGAGVALVWRP